MPITEQFILRFDSMACLDACFTQKRRKSGRKDPVFEHPQSVFIPSEEVAFMERIVNERRGGGAQRGRRKRTAPEMEAADDADEDEVEPGLAVPKSVLDGCEKSFIAADERREKASTTFFADTGLMALLCRHDRVLWLVNMTSAGERQYYALALLDRLFRNLPSNWRMGILYDIGCSIDRSCKKWGFLREWQDRMVFAIAIFHAYGHQWPCQCIYHPRKCEGFGLTDGEGCERFWALLQKLIPGLRVTGVSSDS